MALEEQGGLFDAAAARTTRVERNASSPPANNAVVSCQTTTDTAGASPRGARALQGD